MGINRGKKWVSAGMLFLMCLILSSQASGEPVRKAIISKIRGAVEVKIKEEPWKPAKMGMVLHELDEIRTAKSGFAQTLLDDGASTGKLEIKENSHIRFHTMTLDPVSGDKNTLVDVALGKVKVHAQKLRNQSKFEVNTPTAVLGIRGTLFEVNVSEEKPPGPQEKTSP